MSLPSWPEKQDSQDIPWDDQGTVTPLQLQYERAMKEAYAARLRLAVEALREIKSDPREYESNHAEIAVDALAAIGEVPQG